MNCDEQAAALLECARRDHEPGAGLRAHMTACAACADKWQAERELTAGFRSMRLLATGAALATREARSAAVMAEFDRLRSPLRNRGNAMSRWGWTLAAAAGLVVAVLIGHAAGTRVRSQPRPALRIRALPKPQSLVFEASMDASEISADDFIAVPYTPPLAQGEMVRVIRTELSPEALTSMGIDVDPSAGNNIPAEIVVGGDGLPRAVRITDEVQ